VKSKRPRVGDLVRVVQDYSSDGYDKAGRVALVVRTVGIECVVEPLGQRKQFWFARRLLEVVNEAR
jgi:hypothetical protein